MFREMRRNDKAKTAEDSVKIIKECSNGILSVLGDGGYPYGVPVSYVYYDDRIYFHCATEGHKLDAISKYSKVSFCVVGADNIDQEKITSIYKSVICFGKARMVNTDEEKRSALVAMLNKYHYDVIPDGMKYIENAWNQCHIVAIDIEHMTGKGLEK